MHNIDPDEIAKFNALASQWWDPNGKFKPLHRIDPLRLQFIQQHADGLYGKKVLDVGCGGGILTESMAKEGAQVTGLDMSEKPLQIAKLHALESKLSIEYRLQSVEAHAQQSPHLYDVVTCMEMLEHVPHPASTIAACAQLVKPGGALFFSTINRNFKAWLYLVLGAEYILHILPRGTHDAKKFIRPSELIEWVEQANLSAETIRGYDYNPFTSQASFKSKLDVNYMLFARAPK